jgi:hypothetical protein
MQLEGPGEGCGRGISGHGNALATHGHQERGRTRSRIRHYARPSAMLPARPLPSDRLSPARRQCDHFAAALCYAAWNCSASVEPDRATVSAFGEIAEVTRSK